LKLLFNRIRTSQLITVSAFTAVATIIKLLTSFVFAKIIAVKLGPQGLGILGQLSSFVTIAMTLAVGGISSGVVKYIAEYHESKERQNAIIKAAIIITLSCSLIVGLLISFFSKYWSNLLFGKSVDYSFILIIFGFTIIFYAVFTLFSSVLNGYKEFKKFNYLNIFSSIIGLVFATILIYFYDLNGALISSVTYQSIVFIIIIFIISKLKQVEWRKIYTTVVPQIEYLNLSKFSMMALVSTSCAPVSQIFIRKYLSIHTDAATVGFYEGINRISLLYLGVITTTLSIYYLPRLSEITNKKVLKNEIFKGYKLLLPLSVLILITVYVFKNLVIKVVFAPTFQPMEQYFLPQLIGDFLKIASWLLAFQMLAKAMTKTFIITEIFFNGALVLLSIYFINIYGGIGSVYAYALNYFFYLICMIIIFSKVIFQKYG